jgi:hypothetical protein
VRVALASVALGAIALAGCATGAETSSTATSTNAAPATSAPSAPATAAADAVVPATALDPVGEDAFCDIFAGLAERREGREDFARNETEEDWDRNIATVEQIAAVAPDEVSVQADVYVQMVKDRKALAEANDWADVSELPNDVRMTFAREHAEMQQQVNELIAYAKANCDGVT